MASTRFAMVTSLRPALASGGAMSVSLLRFSRFAAGVEGSMERVRCVRAGRARQSSWAASTRFTMVTSAGPALASGGAMIALYQRVLSLRCGRGGLNGAGRCNRYDVDVRIEPRRALGGGVYTLRDSHQRRARSGLGWSDECVAPRFSRFAAGVEGSMERGAVAGTMCTCGSSLAELLYNVCARASCK